MIITYPAFYLAYIYSILNFYNAFFSSIFHTVLFHRSFGKFTYQDDSSYIIGTIGYEDVDCDYIGGMFFFLKFMFSKKATKIEKIFTVDLTLCSNIALKLSRSIESINPVKWIDSIL